MNPLERGTSRNHIVTVNVEDYFQVGAFRDLIPFDHWERFDTRIQRNTDTTLQLLADTGNTATFFASGWIGENHGEILRKIADAGHEVACSGYYEQSIREIPPLVFRQDVVRSRSAIEDAIGSSVQGFRIGRGRVGPDDLWVLDVLSEEGFLFDSSICPIGRQFSDEMRRFRIHQQATQAGTIWEIPPSTVRRFGWTMPFSGGNYIRQLPTWIIREAAARWVERRDAPLVMYFHIWELDSTQPNISAAPWLQRIRHYRNLREMPDRVRYFLERYPFTSIGNYLDIAGKPIAQTATTKYQPIAATQPMSSTLGPLTDITVVIPCYNEEAALAYLARTLENFVTASRQKLRVNFVLVDDGSNDDTWPLLRNLFGDNKAFQIVRHEHNRGIASAILTGVTHAKSDLVGVLDADCTFNPMQLNEMVDLMSDDVSAVSASPFHSLSAITNVPPWRLALSRGAAFLYRCVLHHQFTSYTSCFRIYRRSALVGLTIYFDGFCGVTEILARLDLAGCKLRECPANLQIRVLGQSKINLLTTIIDHLKLVTRLAGVRWLNIPLPVKSSR